jgi:uncharacterized protein (TIGR02611 family)
MSSAKLSDDALDSTTAPRWAFFRALRARVHALPGGETTWRVLVAVAGLVIVVVGIFLLPLPGPGWLIIFLGLGVWASEFAWASRLLQWTRQQVSQWMAWLKQRSRLVQVVVSVVGVVFLAAVLYACWWLIR